MLNFLQPNNENHSVKEGYTKLNKRVYAINHDNLEKMFELNLQITHLKESTTEVQEEIHNIKKQIEIINKKQENTSTNIRNIEKRLIQTKEAMKYDKILNDIIVINSNTTLKIHNFEVIIDNKMNELYQKQIKNDDDEIESIENEIQIYKEAIESENMAPNIETLEEEQHILLNELHKRTEVLSFVKQKIEEYNKEIKTLNNKNEEKQKELKIIEEEHINNMNELDELNKGISNLNTTIILLKERSKDAESGLSEVKNENYDDIYDNTESSKKNEKRQQNILKRKNIESQIDDLKKIIIETRERIKRFVADGKSKIDEKSFFENQNTRLQTKIEKEEIILNEGQCKFSNNKMKIEELTKSYESVRSEREKLSDHLSLVTKDNLKLKVQSLRLKITLKQQLNEITRREESLKREIKLLNI